MCITLGITNSIVLHFKGKGVSGPGYPKARDDGVMVVANEGSADTLFIFHSLKHTRRIFSLYRYLFSCNPPSLSWPEPLEGERGAGGGDRQALAMPAADDLRSPKIWDLFLGVFPRNNTKPMGGPRYEDGMTRALLNVSQKKKV